MTEEQFFATYANYFFATAVLGVLFLAWLTYWICQTTYKVRQLEREERRLMIEQGMMPPPPPNPLGGWPGVRQREVELRYEERRLLIEKGMQPGANAGEILLELKKNPEEEQPERYLGRGLKTLALGLGLAAGYIIFNTS